MTSYRSSTRLASSWSDDAWRDAEEAPEDQIDEIHAYVCAEDPEVAKVAKALWNAPLFTSLTCI